MYKILFGFCRRDKIVDGDINHPRIRGKKKKKYKKKEHRDHLPELITIV